MRARLIKGLGPLLMLSLVAAACGSDGDTTSESVAPSATAAATTAASATTDAATTTDAEAANTTDAEAADTTASGDPVADTGACTEDLAGGTLTYGSPSQPAGLDPVLVPSSEATGVTAIAQIYDTLIQLDPETGEYQPRVAESLEPDAEFVNWTLTLREGVEFGNGDPLTAEAVKASIERFNELSTGPFKGLTSKIAAMEVEDELTLVFTLDEGWAGFPFTLAVQPGMIVNTAVVDAAGEAFAQDPTGAGVGAYEVDTFTAGEVTVVRAKENYWDGPVCIEELRFVPLPADQARLEAFENDEFDVTYLRDPLVLEAASDISGTGRYVNASSVLLFNAGVGVASPANDVRIRQALAMAIDVDAVNERANEGRGDATGTVIGENSRFELDVAATEQNIEEARALIDAAKADGWDGTLRFICDAGREEVALAIAAQAEAVGVTMNLEVVPTFAPLTDAVIINKDFDTACWGLNISDEAPWVAFNNSLSSGSPANYGGASSPEADAAIDELRVAATDEEITSALNKIQEQWNAIVPSIVLLSTEERVINSDSVTGIDFSSNTMTFFDDASIES
ncbi:MAG: ABC transporter substrate-binding protein [Ilumatobacteraceae bacterium]